jgi:histidine ammonia-lyase
MGTIAARKARTVLEHVETVLAIELLCGAQGIDLRRPLRSSDGIEAAHGVVRRHIAPMFDDRVLYPDLEAALDLVRSGAVVDAVEAVIGPLEA